MTMTTFVILVTILSSVSSLLTQAIKKTFSNAKPVLVIAIVSALVGWAGGAMAYVLMDINWNPSSIICLFLLAPTIWLGATLGYDKVRELLAQIGSPKV